MSGPLRLYVKFCEKTRAPQTDRHWGSCLPATINPRATQETDFVVAASPSGGSRREVVVDSMALPISLLLCRCDVNGPEERRQFQVGMERLELDHVVKGVERFGQLVQSDKACRFRPQATRLSLRHRLYQR